MGLYDRGHVHNISENGLEVIAREKIAASTPWGFGGGFVGPMTSLVEGESSNVRAFKVEREMTV